MIWLTDQLTLSNKIQLLSKKLRIASLNTSREVNEARWPHTCSRLCEFEEKKNRKKNTEKKSAPPKTHHEIHSSPATASNSIRHTTKHVPRVSPYSPAFIDPGFVQIGLVPLSQLEITTNLAHTLTDTLTDRLIKRYSSCRYNERQLICLLYTSPSPRDLSTSRMPSSA